MERKTLSKTFATLIEREEKEPVQVFSVVTEDVRTPRQACRSPRNESDAPVKVKAIFRALIERPLVTHWQSSGGQGLPVADMCLSVSTRARQP